MPRKKNVLNNVDVSVKIRSSFFHDMITIHHHKKLSVAEAQRIINKTLPNAEVISIESFIDER